MEMLCRYLHHIQWRLVGGGTPSLIQGVICHAQGISLNHVFASICGCMLGYLFFSISVASLTQNENATSCRWERQIGDIRRRVLRPNTNPMEGGGEAVEGFTQNVVVLRHGDRADGRRSSWLERAERPWDPPLLPAGRARAWGTGKELRGFGFPIHRVVVSPFLRCLQTAAEVVSALCAVDGSALERSDGSDGVVLDPSMVKVSIEYGLCEVIGSAGVNPKVAPRDGKWFPAISELESLFPTGTIDHSYECIYESIPRWEEQQEDAFRRFARVIQALADKHPCENHLLVTHGQCVAVSIFAHLKGAQINGIKYCAFTHLRRQRSTLTSTSGNEDFKLYNQKGVAMS